MGGALGNIINRLNTRPVFRDVLLAALGLLLAFFLFSVFLNIYTRHGDAQIVPDIIGKIANEELEDLLDDRSLRLYVADCTYIKGMAPLQVIEQDPPPLSKAKSGRKIYVTINAVEPPLTVFPDITDVSLHNAQMTLNNLGLDVAETVYVPDIAKDAVLYFEMDGQRIKPGASIHKGSKITLFVGDGKGNTEIKVPDLIGMQYTKALFTLRGSGLNVGQIFKDEDVYDATQGFVYKQSPAPDATGLVILNAGDAINLYIQKDPVFEDEILDTATTTDSVPAAPAANSAADTANKKPAAAPKNTENKDDDDFF